MKIRVYLFLIIAIFTLGCRKDQTSWNTDWVIPLINDSLLISDYVNDSTLAVNSDQSIQVVLERKLFDLDISAMAKIPDTTVTEEFSIQFQSLLINPNFTFINEVKEHDFSFDDLILTEARIESGYANIRVENPVGTKAIFEVSLPGVYKDGVEFSYSQMVDAGTVSNPGIGVLKLDFSGYTIDLQGVNGNAYNILQSKLSVTSDPEGSPLTITSQDKFKFIVKFENLKFDYGKGYFGNITFSDTTTVNIDALKKIVSGNINIDDLNLQLLIKNGIKANAQANITLFESVNHNQGSTVALNHPYFGQHLNLSAAQGVWGNLTPAELRFTFNNSSGNLKYFLENLGDEYNLGYVIEINPYGNLSAGNDMLFPKSKVEVALKADFPLKVGVGDLVIQDTFAIDFKNEGKLLRVKEGEFILKSTNTFPYGFEVKLDLLDDNNHVLRSVPSVGGVSPALTNSSQNGHLPQESELKFAIDVETAELLKDTRAILVRAKFSSTQLNNNIVYANAALKFVLIGYLKLRATV